MSLVLPVISALGPGSDLWIISDHENSKWYSIINWYLNFNLTRSELHRPPGVAPWLKDLVDRVGLQLPEPEMISEHLLVASHLCLPTSWVSVIPYKNPQKEAKHWVQSAHRVWNQLKQPKIRVFLPNSMDAVTFEGEWQEYLSKPNEAIDDLTLVNA